MGMRGLPAAAATSLEDGVRGTNHPRKASAREEHSEEEQGGSDDRLSSLPNWTSSHKTTAQVPEEGEVLYKLQSDNKTDHLCLLWPRCFVCTP